MREFSQQENQEILKAEQELRTLGLVVDNEDAQGANHNAERIMSFFDLNTAIPVTVQTVLSAVQQMKDQMKWKSRLQMDYEKLYDALSSSDQNAFGSWWFSSAKKTIVIKDEQGFENAVEVLKWTKGRSLDSRTLDLAVSNLLNTHGLHLVPTRQQESQGSQGHQSDGRGLFSKEDTNLTARDHQKRTQAAADKAAGRSAPTPGTDFQALADAVQGSTHSQTANIQRLFVTGPDGKTNWEATLAGRRRVAGL